MLITTTANRSSFSTNANSDEDEDDPFSPERPVQRRTNGNTRNNVHHSEDEEQFELKFSRTKRERSLKLPGL